jgi:15-cis-phytoene desaturase
MIESAAGRSAVSAEFYVAALPVEVLATLMSDELKHAAPSLANLDKLKTRWMNGIQFYLSEDQPLVNGHAIYLDSPWALTSVSQRQFWTNVDLSQYGDGRVRGILSVDISDWDAPGVVFGKPARACSAEEIKKEVWTQLKQHLNDIGTAPIDDAKLVAWFLDPDIEFPNPSGCDQCRASAHQHGRLPTVPAGGAGGVGESLCGLRLRAHLHRHRLYGGGE